VPKRGKEETQAALRKQKLKDLARWTQHRSCAWEEANQKLKMRKVMGRNRRDEQTQAGLRKLKKAALGNRKQEQGKRRQRQAALSNRKQKQAALRSNRRQKQGPVRKRKQKQAALEHNVAP
jgi:hypothetical protein